MSTGCADAAVNLHNSSTLLPAKQARKLANFRQSQRPRSAAVSMQPAKNHRVAASSHFRDDLNSALRTFSNEVHNSAIAINDLYRPHVDPG